ncbi:hypothetical protein ES703_53558 [subsurface metagenome]
MRQPHFAKGCRQNLRLGEIGDSALPFLIYYLPRSVRLIPIICRGLSLVCLLYIGTGEKPLCRCLDTGVLFHGRSMARHPLFVQGIIVEIDAALCISVMDLEYGRG